MKNIQRISSQFAISEEGLHLLRNNFPYKTISSKDWDHFGIKYGHSFKNWLYLLLTGTGMIGSAILYFWYLFFWSSRESFFFAEIAGIGTLVFLGAYCLYLAAKKEEVLEFHYQQKREVFSLKEIKKHYPLQTLVQLLTELRPDLIEEIGSLEKESQA